ncbi:LrgB family protein [Sansalvadorimonas verongulae]|uniref:LrgB family protein n=1 Tax=Sansalvadorimonas verongulae TaxID=2172824 RepID=UPI0018AD1605|nr:LrgB family protein [Sansalvadorimonas verongulae]
MNDTLTVFKGMITTPLFMLTLTIGSFLLGQAIYKRCGRFAILPPLVIAAIIITVTLKWLDVDYSQYKESVQILGLLLGTATVSLAIPLYQQLHLIRSYARPLLVTVIAGGFFAPVSAVAIAWLFGATDLTLRSLLTKSITMPIALATTENLGGLPAITAGAVVLSGIVGATFALPIMNRLKIHSPVVRGFTMGLTAHVIGTVRAFESDKMTGSFSSLGLAITGAFAGLAIPLIYHLVIAF